MKKRNNLIRFWFFVIIIFLVVYFGDVRLQFGSAEAGSQKIFVNNLTKLQNITGQMWISPWNSQTKFIPQISKTKNKLWIQTYEFTNKDIKKLFKDLANRGADIRIIIEDNKYQQFSNTLKVLRTYFTWYNNVWLKSDKWMWTEYVHSKINILDSWFIIQTANLTLSSFKTNREYFLWSTNTGILFSLNKIFLRDWSGEKIQASDIHPNLVICNINCRTVIEKLLNNARQSITIQTQYITDPGILKILKNKSDLKLNLLLANTPENDYVVKYFGPKRARIFKKYYNHTKMILVDNKTLLLWSMNLSANSLDKNREIWILLIDPSLIQIFINQFWKDRVSK